MIKFGKCDICLKEQDLAEVPLIPIVGKKYLLCIDCRMLISDHIKNLKDLVKQVKEDR